MSCLCDKIIIPLDFSPDLALPPRIGLLRKEPSTRSIGPPRTGLHTGAHNQSVWRTPDENGKRQITRNDQANSHLISIHKHRTASNMLGKLKSWPRTLDEKGGKDIGESDSLSRFGHWIPNYPAQILLALAGFVD